MIILQVYFKEHARAQPNMVWEIIEFQHDTMDEVMDDIMDDEVMLSGNRIDARMGPGKGPERIINRRTRVDFRGTAVERVQEMTWVFKEPVT